MISLFYRHAVASTMEYLKRHLGDYEDATQKEPKAKRALIHTLYEVLSVAEIVEKEVKDKATFDALFEKYTSTKSKSSKGFAEISKKIKDYDKAMNAYRSLLDKPPPPPKVKADKPIVGGGGNVIVDSAETGKKVPDEDPTAVKLTKVSGKTGKKTAKEGKDKITLAMREEIWDKYIGDKSKAKCPVCQTSIIKMTGFSAGHIIAEAVGGVTNITNLVPICGHCNSRMSTENLFDYTLKNYMRAPVFPGMDAVSEESIGGEGKVKKGEGKKGGGK